MFHFRFRVLFPILMLLPGFVSADPIAANTPLKALNNGVHLHRLSNGLRVLMYRRGIAPVFSAVLAVRVGSSDEVPGETGISHMFEHMAFKGTKRIGTRDYSREKPLLDELEVIAAESGGARDMSPALQQRWEEIQKELSELWIPEAFSREFENAGASGLNASTGTDLTQYYVSMPRRYFEFWCQMESARLLEPVLRQFYQERDVVREEQRTRSEDDPGGKLSESLNAVAFLMHSYRRPVIGYVEDIERLTARKLEAFRDRYYVPENIVIALVGDIDVENDQEMLEKYFGRLPQRPMPERSHISEKTQDGEKQVIINFHAYPQFAVAYKKPQYPHPDDAPITVMTEILNGGKTTPLYRELIERQKVAASVDSGEGPGTAYPNLLNFFMVPRAHHNSREVLNAFDKIIEDFKEKEVSEEALGIAKRTVVMGYFDNMNSSMSLAESLASAELIHKSWTAMIDWYDQVMKTTAADVQRVARTYLRREKRTLAWLETKQDGKAAKK